jgi:hypothetical protein
MAQKVAFFAPLPPQERRDVMLLRGARDRVLQEKAFWFARFVVLDPRFLLETTDQQMTSEGETVVIVWRLPSASAWRPAGRRTRHRPAKNGIFAPFIYKREHFAKTGSGQT